MKLRALAVAGLGLLLLGSTAARAATTPTAAPAASAPAAAAAPAKPKVAYCDRQCLMDTMEKFLSAMAAHDPHKAPIGKGFVYAENEIVLKAPDGLWRTVTSIGPYRLYVVEPGHDVAVYVDAKENDLPFLLSVRLKMSGRTIVGAEAVTNGRDNYGTPSANVAPRAVRPQFLETVPASERVSRKEMMRLANTYFDGIEANVGDHVPPFSDDCVRIENGNPTSGRPLKDGATPNSANFGCAESMRMGYYRDDTRIRDRRYLIVDQEHGLVYAQCFFDHDATVRSYKLKNGQTVNISRHSPWTWVISEIFQIRNGKIGQVEAINYAAPYGQPSAFHDGVPYPTHGK